MKINLTVVASCVSTILVGVASYVVYDSRKNTDKLIKKGEAIHKKSEELIKESGKVREDLETITNDISVAAANRIAETPMIKEAVDRSVGVHLKRVVQATCDKAVDEEKTFITSQIKQAVRRSWDEFKGDVKDNLRREAGKLDVDEIKREAVLQAKEEALDSVHDAVDEALDSLKEKYEEKIEDYMDDFKDRYEKKLDRYLEGLDDRYKDKIRDIISDLKYAK